MHCIDRYISLDGNRVCCWHFQKFGPFFVACYPTVGYKESWPLEDIIVHLIREEATRCPKQSVERQFFVWEEL
jgi:hypothetical protein